MASNSPAEVRARVEEIWNDVLGAPADRPEATFFDLGGQSMSAIRIVARIEDELGLNLDVSELFEDPDLDTLVRAVLTKVEIPKAS